MKKRLHLLVAISILSTASAVSLSGCSSAPTVQAAAAQGAAVKTITLSGEGGPGASGKIAPLQTVHIYSELPGRVESVLVDEGSKVKKGDVLVQLETNDLTQKLAQAQATLDAAQANLNNTLNGTRSQDLQAAEAAVGQAKGALDSASAGVDQAKSAYDLTTKTYNQTKNHYDEGTLTKSDMDNATLNFDKAKAGYDQAVSGQASAKAALAAAQAKLDLLRAGATPDTIAALKAQVSLAQASLELAKSALDNAAIKAPSDGIIVKRTVQPGEMAFTSMPSGTELLTMVAMDPVNVEASVPETLVANVKQGASVKVTLPSIPGKTFDGTVSFVSPVSDQNNNTFPIKVTVNNPDGTLRAGAVANVSFDGSQQTRLELPKTALVKDGSGQAVFKLDGDTVHKVAVQTEDKSQDLVYIKDGSGLKSGDKIVLNPGDQLTDGAKVRAE